MENLKIISENKNDLFKRNEVVLEITSQISPSKVEVDELLSKKYSTVPEKIRIKKIAGKFGSHVFTISAHIYPTKEDMFAVEHFSKKEKQRIEKFEQEKNKPAEEIKEEKPEETKSEEKNE